MKILVSLNWVIGSICLVLAVSYGFISGVLGGTYYSVAEQTVGLLVKAEQGHYPGSQRYIEFSGDKLGVSKAFSQLGLSEPQDDDFLYEAIANDEVLVITARTNPALTLTKAYRPMLYTARIEKGELVSAQWRQLSTEKRGLGLF